MRCLSYGEYSGFCGSAELLVAFIAVQNQLCLKTLIIHFLKDML